MRNENNQPPPAMSDLPENNRIQKLLTIEEIAAMMDSGDYSAEMLLQHLCAHWNRRDGWMPIDTAPKDGSQFLATGWDNNVVESNRHYACAWWLEERKQFIEGSDDALDDAQTLSYLTHWQPLPNPPAQPPR